jgi:small subunit ribosomal protein S17
MDEAINNVESPAGTSAPATETTTKPTAQARGQRAEKIGIITSDKMTKTVVVRVDRLVKHPIYKRYVRKRSKFMAHNEIEGVSIGDQVRIVETRPLSARKRWRVVEVLRKASK